MAAGGDGALRTRRRVVARRRRRGHVRRAARARPAPRGGGAAAAQRDGLHQRPGGARKASAGACSSTSTRASAQMWRELGLHDAFAGHDAFVTVGMNVGQPKLPDPDLRPRLDYHPAAGGAGAVAGGAPPADDAPFTSVGAWRGPNGPVEFARHHLRPAGARVSAVRRAAGDVPGRAVRDGVRHSPRRREGHRRPGAQRAGGWSTRPRWRRRRRTTARYVAGSRGEFMVPKQMYVATRSGLLSDRSAYYLASGRPVLARDTGLAGAVPDRRRAAAVLDAGRGGGGGATICGGLRAPRAERRGRSRRNVSTRTRCCGAAGPTGSGTMTTSTATGVKRLNWGCGGHTLPGWINSDQKDGDGSTCPATSREGLPLETAASTTPSASTRCPRCPTTGSSRCWPSCAGCYQARRHPAAVPPGPDQGNRRATSAGDRDYFLVPDEDAKSLGREARDATALVRLLAHALHPRLRSRCC